MAEKKKKYQNNLNSTIIEGEVAQVQRGEGSLHFVVNVHRFYRDGGAIIEEIIFVDVCAFGRLAEAVKIEPGDSVRVVGRLSNLNYLGYLGQYALEVIAEHIEAVGGEK